MTTETTNAPDVWVVARHFVWPRHTPGAATYSPGSPLPDLTREQCEQLEREGVLVKLLPDGTVPQPEKVEPKEIEAYLLMPAAGVLHLLRVHRPPTSTVKAILKLAEASGREVVLLEALRYKLNIPAVE